MKIIVVVVVLASLIESLIPIVVARGIHVLAGNPATQLLLAITGTVLMLGSLSWIFNFVQQTLSTWVVSHVIFAVRQDVFAAVLQHDLSFYDENSSGKIISRVTSDTQSFATVVTLTIHLLSQILLVLIVGAALMLIDLRLALVTLALAPVVIFTALGFRHLARRTSRYAQRAHAQVNTAIQEMISGIAIAKNFRQEAAIYNDFVTTNRQAYYVRLWQSSVFTAIFPALDVLAGISTALILYFGGLWVIDGFVSAGHWYFFVQSLAIFYFPLTSIASFWSQFQQGLAASERIFAIIDAEAKVKQIGQERIDRVDGRISFRHVQLSYHAGLTVLPDFSLEIPAGQKIAIVGHTGAGKSTLIRLIARFYEFQSGRLAIDGHDIRRLDLAHYRRSLGIVPQTPFLFSGTIADNIRYGQPDASDEAVLHAAAAIGQGDWLNDLPHGLHTQVGERGLQLSLGQRQLVALSRVLLQDPSIILLDEATASVDLLTEAQIREGLDTVMHGRTSIIVAHRLSTVQAADRILVMKDGKIVEDGTHHELLRTNSYYSELYTTYFRHQSLAYIEGRHDTVA